MDESFRLSVTNTEDCRVYAGAGCLAELGALIEEIAPDRVLGIADEAVLARARALPLAPAPDWIPLHAEEAAKSWTTLAQLAEELFARGASRRSLLIAAGGGITTDLAGSLAALYMRGIPVVLVPTTLLGMVDASLGGKNGVHLGTAKNILGTIRQPAGIVADAAWLDTLDEALYREGLVEVVKVAAVTDAPFFERLEARVDALIAREPAVLGATIREALEAKAAVVRRDAFEGGTRQLLNYGHTVGHAIESASEFGIRHGLAVALGIRIENRLAPFADAERVEALLQHLGIDLDLPGGFTAEQLWAFMTRDKKASAGVVRVALPAAIGLGVVREVLPAEFADALNCT